MRQDDVRALLEQRAEAANVVVPSEIAERLETYFRLLAHWNRKINLTSLPLEPPTAAAIDRILVEPLVAIAFVAPRISTWFDLGSGGGSPAIPLQVAHPAKRLVMVESRERKVAFLREVVRELQLDGSEVFGNRIETLLDDPANRASADLVTVRAVRLSAPLFSQLDLLLKPGGQAVLFGTGPQKLDLPRGLDVQIIDPPLVVLRRTP
jgi:16S rRNA (guanine527-N7)-methyltransferase